MKSGIGVRELYNSISSPSGYGIPGYEVGKVYCDPLQQIKQRQYAKIKKGQKSRQHQTKRGNFIDDQTKLHKFSPGPGTYKSEMQWPEKEKMKRNVTDKLTYIDEIIKSNKKNKWPAPGSYNVVKTLKQLDKERKIMAQKKIKASDKLTFIDKVQYQSTFVPGAGNYNPRVRAKTETSDSKMNKKPQDWRKIHGEMDKKKPEKSPDMTTYTPQATYELFESISKRKIGKSVLDKTQRFKTFSKAIHLPPTKYSVIQKWKGKTEGKQKSQRHGYESISKGMCKSVYY